MSTTSRIDGARREDPLLLRDVLLEDVRLDGAAQLLERRRPAPRRRTRRTRAASPPGALIVIEVETSPSGIPSKSVSMSASESIATPSRPDLAERARVVGVVAHQRRHVERRREAGLPVVEQVAEARVRLLRRPEAGELAHRPEPAAVHRRVDAARERDTRRASRGRARSRARRSRASRAARSRRRRWSRRARPRARASPRTGAATRRRRPSTPRGRSSPFRRKCRAGGTVGAAPKRPPQGVVSARVAHRSWWPWLL